MSPFIPDNVAIQVYLTAAVMNLKRLARALTLPNGALGAPIAPARVLRCLLNDASRLWRWVIATPAFRRSVPAWAA